MAAGLPMVVTDVGGNPEAVINGENGFVVPPCDPGALGKAILRLATDGKARREMGQAGRRRIEALFSLDACVDRYRAIYGSLIQGRRGPVRDLIAHASDKRERA